MPLANKFNDLKMNRAAGLPVLFLIFLLFAGNSAALAFEASSLGDSVLWTVRAALAAAALCHLIWGDGSLTAVGFVLTFAGACTGWATASFTAMTGNTAIVLALLTGGCSPIVYFFIIAIFKSRSAWSKK